MSEAPGSSRGGRRALVTFTLWPLDDALHLTPPSLLSGQTGYRAPAFNLMPQLQYGNPAATSGLSGLGGAASASGATASGASGSTGGDAAGGGTAAPGNGWSVVSQAVVQLNPANATFTAKAPAPLPAVTLQGNLLFSGFGDKFQIGEYYSGSGTLAIDGYGRSYGVSFGVLIGGNDLWVSGALSYINPKLKVSPFNPQLQVGPSFGNLGRPDANAQIGGNLSDFVNFNLEGSAVTVGIGGQFGYSHDLATRINGVNASLLLQFQLQKKLSK